MRVGEVMTSPVQTIRTGEAAADAWEAMRRFRVRHLVVTSSEGHVCGVISSSDLGGKHGDGMRAGRTVAELMTEKVVVAAPDTTVRAAANLMRGHEINCLPVFDGPTLKGIVTTQDLLDLIGRGADRPVATATRRVMKDRGVKPAVANAATRLRGKRGSRG